ncbi:MAG: pyrroloquinoline quinone-dependent dehydrogenase [Vicinamibacterales bacterium]|jgi:quinoprotein glucose dehydrogenase|nr:pyrroloquinoline quinone-dependent dehydrogenase [Vicinamibacterales bacterium]MDP7480308.1 pyrroloquinoline quinone-dependent dehydrogenase [Vicinamibacterales bacterium]MDP7691693.1 pyrroloquinoline quinone-dependent dehydrogenase [Vicinamibacterales bacterium]HJN45091.1 pyrroloquinoline quinone-dependent dehydrogenase [Vicinamibacterales bacterium]
MAQFPTRLAFGLGLLAIAASPSAAHAQQDGQWQTYGTENGEWRSYAGNIAGQKYSPLEQIDASNFEDLEIAWSWESADKMVSRTMPDGSEWWAPLDTIVESLVEDTPNLYRTGHLPRAGGMAATPLMVGGVLFFNTALSQGVAVDATTGETLWVFNPKSYEEGTTPMSGTFRQRGVAYWTDGEGDERIFWGTGAGHLVCVNAKTGQPCADFGPDGSGMVDAMVGLPRANREERDYLNALLYGIHSPPIVVRDKVIHGSQVADRRITKEAVPGWVRAWDVKTGEHSWDFHTVPNSADEFGADTWLNDSWRYSGNANVWSMLSGDNELGHVYLPTGTATNDYYGADRPGDNLYSETIIAVDVETGARVWHFQAVHHGLWDYDFPTHSNLVDLTVDGRDIKALVQVSKQGFVYAFDRVTGDPIWPIEERPVPTDTNMPGEWVSPTQPFPTKPAPFEYQGVTIDDLVDFTPEIREMAIEAVKPFRLGPLFTPTSRPVEGGWQGTLMRPPDGGAATWAGAAIDPETGMLYVPSRNNAVVISLYEPDPTLGATVAYTHGAPEADRLAGRGLGPSRSGALMPQGLPLLKPPYSRMTAIDMNTGEHEWMVPLGNGDRYRNHPLLRDLNLPPLGGDGVGGPVLTKTLLVSALSAGSSNGGPRLVARSKETGEELGSVDLPTGAIGTPMTYMVDGRQYFAVAIGGRPPQMVAFALPE